MKTSYKNLSDFISSLKNAGELLTVSKPVSHYLEISRLTDAESKSPDGGKALFFENVKGSPFPAATNLFGSPKRICMAMGVTNLDQLGSRIRDITEISPPKNLKDILGLLSAGISVSRFFPRLLHSKHPPCQEVVYTGENIDLSILPVLHCWPEDAGPFITLPLVFTKSLKTGGRNVGMYRLQVFDKNTTGMHWHIHKDGSHYYNEYRRAKKRMPVAVAIGADPATIYSSTAPMPRDLDEMVLAGFIRNRPVSMTQCLTIDMQVPAEAEFILEGYVEPEELRKEGPFGDHTGYYSLADDYPVFHVTALTHRKKPVYCATLVGRPPMEDCYLAKATERLFLPLLQRVFPEIKDYWLPWEGVFHNIAVVSINKEYPGHAHKIMHGLWGQGQMSFCKAIVVVDRDVDLARPEQIIERLLQNLDVQTDLIFTKGILDVLDHSSPTPNFGSKIGIDLTARFPGEPGRTEPAYESSVSDISFEEIPGWIKEKLDGVISARYFSFSQKNKNFVQRNFILFLCVENELKKQGDFYAKQIHKITEIDTFNIIILYDAKIDLSDNSLLLWKMFNNVDPERDIFIEKGRVVINACRKYTGDQHPREWPDELCF